MTILEMMEKRAKLVAEAREIHARAEKEGRAPSAEERQIFDKIMVDVDKLKDDVTAEERLLSAESELTASKRQVPQGGIEDLKKPEKRVIELRTSQGMMRHVEIEVNEERAAAFRNYLVNGASRLSASDFRALSKDSDTQGGYLSAPLEWNANIIKSIDNLVFLRQQGTVLPPLLTAESLGCPTIENNISDSDWTSELGTGDEDSTLSFGRRDLSPHPLAKRIKISKTLLRRSATSADTIVNNQLAYKAGVSEERAFMTGSGAGQPLGLFTASAQGISTDRDVSTGNSNTAFTMDGLINAQMSCKAAHRKNGSWLFHRDSVKMLRILKTTDLQYVWQPGAKVGEPDMLLGNPIFESEYVPNTFTTGLYLGLFGDLKYYWIADALSMSIQVLTELYAATNQNGYIGRLECDGMPVLEEAFARVKTT